MTASLDALLEEHAELERALADPSVHTDAAQARKLGRRYAELGPVVAACARAGRGPRRRDRRARAGDRGPVVRRRGPRAARPRRELEARLAELLVPRDPHDGDDVIMEVKSGEGGEESALFAGDLARMYLRYAERRGWKAEILGGTDSDLGGYKDVTLLIRSRASDPDGVWARAEVRGRRAPGAAGAGHRVAGPDPHVGGGRARLPRRRVTTPTVDDRRQRPADRRVPLVGPRRAERQHHRLGRADHPPADRHRRVVPERESQLQNRARAMEVLRARLQALAEEEAAAKASAARRSQVRTVDRSERVRTYNFPENRISDHRVGYKAYNLDRGARRRPGRVLDALATADAAAQLAAGVEHVTERARSPLSTVLGACRRRAWRGEGVNREPPAAGAARGGADPRGRRCREPGVDAELLAAHVVGVRRGRLMTAPLVDAPVLEEYRAAGGAPGGPRAAAAPARHGRARAGRGGRRGRACSPRGRRPSCCWSGASRRSAGTSRRRWWWTCARARARSRWPSPPRGRTPRCTPSRLDPGALAWARRNVPRTRRGGRRSCCTPADVRRPDLLPELEARVDLVLCNPPYVPDGTPVAARGGRGRPGGARVRRSGRAGGHPAVIAACGGAAAPGGWLAIEHDDTHGEPVPALLRGRRVLTDVTEHGDLAGRPRFATARRAAAR